MKATPIIGLALLVAASVAEARTSSDVLKTPVGLEIRIVGVHNAVGGTYNPVRFRHGNRTVRMEVSNPTAVDQPLTVAFKTIVGPMRVFGRVSAAKCVVTRLVPPGKNYPLDFSLPHIGAMRVSMRTEDWQFTDASGRAADTRNFLFGDNGADFVMPENCADEFVIAVSPSFADVDKLTGQCVIEKPDKASMGKSCGGKSSDISANRPDFTRFRDWRDLACYDALLFTKADWEKTTPEFRELVQDYEAAGGKFLLAESGKDVEIVSFLEVLRSASRALCGYGADSSFAGDREALREVEARKHAMPFGGIVLVLLVFSVLAGPVTVLILAKRGQRIQLLWVFPSVAIVFSVVVALTIVFTNGLEVKTQVFDCTVERPDLNRKVVVKNTVYVAPFPMSEPIRTSPAALVTFDSGSDRTCGDGIVSTSDALLFVGNWTPCLWPVRVREMEVVRTSKEDAK